MYLCLFSDLIGFIDEVEKKHLASNNAFVIKIVINNGSGRRIQIVSWGKYIDKMEVVADLENVSTAVIHSI